MSALERLAAGKYLSLTTYRRDGTPVATPVWVAREQDHLYVITPVGSGKVKRLRHTSRVSLAPCDVRGGLTGPSTDADAQLLDADGTAHVRGLIDSKYGLLSKAMALLDVAVRNRGKSNKSVGIEITVAERG